MKNKELATLWAAKQNMKGRNEEPFKLNLQLFGDGGGDGGSGGDDGKGGAGGDDGKGGGGGDDGKDKKNELPKTAEELQKLLQSETDKRVTQALKTAQEKWEKELKEKLESEKAEAEKLAKMSAAEREKALLDKQKKELEDKEKLIAQKELKLATIDILKEKQLPIEFADYVMAADADTIKKNIDTFAAAWQKALEEAVEAKFKSNGRDIFKSLGDKGSEGSLGKKLAEQNAQNAKIQSESPYFK
jgi:flagellar biosynthesis GTPase FlhF